MLCVEPIGNNETGVGERHDGFRPSDPALCRVRPGGRDDVHGCAGGYPPAQQASASTLPTIRIVNANGGVYWRSQPNWNSAVRRSGYGVYTGDTVRLNCYMFGVTMPGTSNRLWYDATVVAGRGKGSGGLSDHFLATPWSVPNRVMSGVPHCGSGITVASAPRPHTYINGIDVGYSQNGKHWWGQCLVQDFKYGTYGWVIVDYTSGHPVTVRNGMLWGWFDNGGAPGRLGCPLNQEYGYMYGAKEDFQHGSLVWSYGMNHAQRITNDRIEQALGWAWEHVNTYFWPNLCLKFVVYSYIDGAHWTLKGPYGRNVRAVDWWNTNQSPAPRHRGDMNPPRGALVYWSYWLGGDGHAAISLGGGYAISTEFNGNRNVHVFKISSVPWHYLGWRMPV